LFDETFYLINNEDVLTAVSLGLTTAFEHFSTFGHRENRPLLPFFDAQAYLLDNSDLKGATTQPGWVSAWNHFVLFGILEGRSPNGSTGFTGLFDNAKYLQQNQDVDTAVSNGAFRNGFEHYLLFGAKEGRAAFDKAGNAIDPQFSTGKTFTLTTGVDNIVGTSGNDTIIADNIVSTQLSVADKINGGAGTDTLKIYQPSGFALENTVFGQLTSVEKIYINNGKLTAGGTLDISGLGGVIAIELDSAKFPGGAATFTLKTGAAQSVTLTNIAGQDPGAQEIIKINGAKDVTLNGVTLSGGGNDRLNIAASGTTSLNLTALGAASTIELDNTGLNLATLTITGNKALTLTTSATNLKTVTSTSTADVTFNNTGGSVENYTGGAGRDILTLVGAKVKNVSTGAGNDTVNIVTSALAAASTIDLGDGDDILSVPAGGLANLTSGAQLVGGAGIDRLVTNESSTLTALQIAKINQSSGFEVLGFAANGSGVDVSQLTSINKFYVEGNTGVQITKANSNTQTTIDLTTTNSNIIAIGNASFENSTTVVIDNQSGTSQTLFTLTVTGIPNVALSSTGKSGSSNIITTLSNSDNTVVTITGDRDLTISNITGNTTAGSKVDASAFTGNLKVTGSGKADILIGGAGNDTIEGGAGADTITGGAGADTFRYTGGGTVVRGVANVDWVKDFNAAEDKFSFGTGPGNLVDTLNFSTNTTVTVGNLTVVSAANISDVFTAIGSSVPASTATNASAAIVTVTAGAAAGTYLFVNDGAPLANAGNDFLVQITGVSGTITAANFLFA